MKRTVVTISLLCRLVLYSSLIVPIVPQLRQPGHLQILSKILIKVASYLTVKGRFKRNREGKYLDDSRGNEKKKKKVRKLKEEI